VNIAVTLSILKDAVVVPEAAIKQSQQGPYLYVVKPDMTAEMRPAVIVQSYAGEAALAEGARPGDTVVTDGQLRVVPGARVEINTGSKAEGGAPQFHP
jgi:multidrug efflux system membrane fusion protein